MACADQSGSPGAGAGAWQPSPRPAEQRAVAGFARIFSTRPAVVGWAPGRVNLLGEHTDYTGGLVLPMAMDRGVAVALRPRGDGRVRIAALDFDDTIESTLDDAPPTPGTAHWSGYPRGVLWALREHGHATRGCDLALTGDLPVGGGLSSSAAVCVATAFALAVAFDLPLDRRRLALVAHRAETGFVGVQCGIMDQFASALSVAEHALFIDCHDMETRPVPLRLAGAGLTCVVIDSGVPRTLAASAYNTRVAECAEALTAARRAFPDRSIASLRDLTSHDLIPLARHVRPAVLRRARHVVTENARVQAALVALDRDDWDAFGAYMRDSHGSLRDDYEVSTPELDRLVELVSAVPGVLGARLTGAGFGGCTVQLAMADRLAELAEALSRYEAETGRRATMLISRPSEGASVQRVRGDI